MLNICVILFLRRIRKVGLRAHLLGEFIMNKRLLALLILGVSDIGAMQPKGERQKCLRLQLSKMLVVHII